MARVSTSARACDQAVPTDLAVDVFEGVLAGLVDFERAFVACRRTACAAADPAPLRRRGCRRSCRALDLVNRRAISRQNMVIVASVSLLVSLISCAAIRRLAGARR